MNILVTGSEGYIGKHLVNFLKEKKEFKIYTLDIKDSNPIDINKKININKKIDVIVHLAALVSVPESIEKPIDYYLTNIFGTYNLIKSLRCKYFIFASTSQAGQQKNPYSRSKKAAEEIVQRYCKKYTIFRFYNVIGSNGFLPTNKDSLYFNLLKAEKSGVFKIFGNNYKTKDGTCIRDYIHVLEICESIYKAINKPSNSIENLGHGKGWTVKEIAETFRKVNNSKFNIKICKRRKGDTPISIAKNISKYMTNIFSLENMLKKY